MNESTVWTTSAGNNQRTGLFGSHGVAQKESVHVLKANGPVHASPVCAPDGRVFVVDTAGYGLMFSSDGYLEGSRKLDGAIHATPALTPDGSKIFIGTAKGFVCCYDTSNGDILWKIKIPTEHDPRILSDFLYIEKYNLVITSSWGERFVALDADNGETKFTWDAGRSPYAPATADKDGNIYTLRAEILWENDVNKSGFRMVKVNGETGEEVSLFHQPNSEDFPISDIQYSAAPVLDEKNELLWFVLNEAESSTIAAIDLTQGRFVPKDFVLERNVLATPCLDVDGQLAVADLKGIVHIIKPMVNQKYQTNAHYLLAGPVTDQLGYIYQADIEGRLHRLTSEGEGEVVFEAPRSIEAKPAFTPDGHLLLPCTDGNVYWL